MCCSQLLSAHKRRWLNFQEVCNPVDLILVMWNQLWWEYLYHWNWQRLQIRASFFSFLRTCCLTFTGMMPLENLRAYEGECVSSHCQVPPKSHLLALVPWKTVLRRIVKLHLWVSIIKTCPKCEVTSVMEGRVAAATPCPCHIPGTV